MRLKTRVLIIVLASLLGLVIMGIFGLFTTKQAMMAERRAQITMLLDFAHAQLGYFHAQEVAGKMTREEAQARAKEAISARAATITSCVRSRTTSCWCMPPPRASARSIRAARRLTVAR